MDETPAPGARGSTAFTVDLDDATTRRRSVDPARIEALLEKSRARHRRAHSSTSADKTTSAAAGPSDGGRAAPMSAKLPRRAHGYNSEGYFSSDQDETMTATATTPQRLLDLPLRLRKFSAADAAPMIADTSSPETDPLVTPGSRCSSALQTPRTPKSPPKKSPPDKEEPPPPPIKMESSPTRPESPSSTVSEAGTYTIEADNYTEEQKARMSIGGDLRQELRLAEAVPDRPPPPLNVLEIECYHDEELQPPQEPVDRVSDRVATPEELDVGSFTSVTASGVLGADAKRVAARKDRPPPQTDRLVVQKVTSDGFEPAPSTERHRGGGGGGGGIAARLSHMSLNRSDGDKSWIREWADSVKRHNATTVVEGLPPMSPRHKGISSPVNSPTKIPSPVSTLMRQRAAVPDILTSTPETESYLQNTQNAITSLQAKLQNAKSSPLANLFRDHEFRTPDRFAPASKLPVSQLSRSNSLNYRLYRKTAGSAESSPLRNPGNYLVTGTPHAHGTAARLLLSNLGASKSLDTETSPVDGGVRRCYSPVDQFNGYGRSGYHQRHRSFDAPERYEEDFHNANMTQSLNLKSSTRNVFEEDVRINSYGGEVKRRSMDQTTKGTIVASSHGNRDPARRTVAMKDAQNSPIRRSSSFNIVNKNNNVYDHNVKNLLRSPVPRISSSAGRSRMSQRLPPHDRMHFSADYSTMRHNTPELDCMSEDSDNVSTGGFYSDYDRRSFKKPSSSDLLVGARVNRAFALRRARLESSPDARSPARGPATPEMKRKFPVEVVEAKKTNKAAADSRGSEPRGRVPDGRPDVCQVVESAKAPKNKNKISDTLKQTVMNRLTRSSSSARDFAPKSSEKSNSKKPTKANHTVNPKEVELSNWKKRTSYDPMKAAQEAKKKLVSEKNKPDDTPPLHARLEDILSPSHSSPVHRSRSFNCPNTPIDERLYLLQHLQNDASSDTDDFDDRLICTLPNEGSANTPILKMVSAAEAERELASKLANAPDVTKRTKRGPQNAQIKLSTDYVTKLQIADLRKASPMDKRKTYLIDSELQYDSLVEADKRRTFILDSDTTTNSTTNGSESRRNSSIYSDEKMNHERISDSEAESDTEPIVNVVPRVKSRSVPPQQRHSGDFSMSSSSCSAPRDTKEGSVPSARKPIQPRYLDISRFKSESSTNKNFLRRDPSKTYVGVLPVQDQRHQAKKNAARQNEQEQKNRELEKWKRRASYDPRKAAAQAKTKPIGTKSPSNSVLRSQSFHGPMLQQQTTAKLTLVPLEKKHAESYYQDISSDNEF